MRCITCQSIDKVSKGYCLKCRIEWVRSHILKDQRPTIMICDVCQDRQSLQSYPQCYDCLNPGLIIKEVSPAFIAARLSLIYGFKSTYKQAKLI